MWDFASWRPTPARARTLIEQVEDRGKIIIEYERNIGVLQSKIDEERLAIQELQKQCPKHDFQHVPRAGEHERACVNCGMTI